MDKTSNSMTENDMSAAAEGVGEDTPRRQALRRMVEMDEEMEAKHPGWMSGTTPDHSSAAASGVEGLREAANSAAYRAIYGSEMDPFKHPEGWEYAGTVADAILSALAAQHRQQAVVEMRELSVDDAEALYDRIHLEELSKGGRLGAIRLRVVRRFNAEERAALARSQDNEGGGK